MRIEDRGSQKKRSRTAGTICPVFSILNVTVQPTAEKYTKFKQKRQNCSYIYALFTVYKRPLGPAGWPKMSIFGTG